MVTALTKADAKVLQGCLERIDNAKKNLTDSVLIIGKELVAAREILPHGEFLPWVEENCRFAQRTAYNYLAAFEMFGSFRRIESIEHESLMALARCKPAAIEAKELANHGQRIDAAKAKALIEKAKAAKPAKEPESQICNGVANSHTGQDGSGAPAAETAESESPKSSDCNGEQASAPEFTCPNCGGHEADEDGDCAKCHEPAAPAEAEPEPEGGYEPSEARKPLDKLFKALGDAARNCKDAQKILPNCVHLADCFAAIDKASLALHRSRTSFKRRPK